MISIVACLLGELMAAVSSEQNIRKGGNGSGEEV